LLVVLEDVHWADEMSVRLLAFLGRRLNELPLLLEDGVEGDEDVAETSVSFDSPSTSLTRPAR
jgi:hypothetical protein